jgi:hypothetical protein
MNPVISLDPASLALWTNLSAMGRAPAAPLFSLIVNIASGDKPTELQEIICEVKDEKLKARLINLASCVWHEKRHFLDLILTNYGAFRIRQFFHVYANVFSVLAEHRRAQEHLLCPIYAYADPVRASTLSLSPAMEKTNELARELLWVNDWIDNDRMLIQGKGGQFVVGGESMLEALAVLFQSGAAIEVFGFDGHLWQSDLAAPIGRNSKYFSFFRIGQQLGICPFEEVGEFNLINASALVPLLYASLLARGWKQEQTRVASGSSGAPGNRVAAIIPELRKREELRGPKASATTIWLLVNDIAKHLFGRSAIEELNEDYKFEEQLCERFRRSMTPPEVTNAFLDFHELRGKLINVLKTTPEQILEIESFTHSLLPKLQPIEVTAQPDGINGEVPKAYAAVFSYKDPQHQQPEGKWWWAVAPEDYGLYNHVYALNWNKWFPVIRELAPLAKLIMHGRRQRTMLPCELICIENMLRADGYQIRIDPMFDAVVDVENSDSFFHLNMVDQAVCDFCKEPINRPAGYLLSPWLFRANQLIAEATIRAFGGGVHGQLRFWKDWSPWFVCDICRRKLLSLYEVSSGQPPSKAAGAKQ